MIAVQEKVVNDPPMEISCAEAGKHLTPAEQRAFKTDFGLP